MKAVDDFFNNLENELGNRKQPLVTLSYAQSLDGSIARRRGFPLQISGVEAQQVTHYLRSIHDGILIGIGTVISDDPLLTVREVEGPDPQPIILDPNLKIQPSARIFEHPKPPWICYGSIPRSIKVNMLEKLGCTVFCTKSISPQIRLLNLAGILSTLKGEGIQRLMVEGGGRVIQSFLDAGLVDAVVLTIAPFFVGGVKAVEQVFVDSRQKNRLPRLENPQIKMAGEDIVIWGKLLNSNP